MTRTTNVDCAECSLSLSRCADQSALNCLASTDGRWGRVLVLVVVGASRHLCEFAVATMFNCKKKEATHETGWWWWWWWWWSSSVEQVQRAKWRSFCDFSHRLSSSVCLFSRVTLEPIAPSSLMGAFWASKLSSSYNSSMSFQVYNFNAVININFLKVYSLLSSL